MREHYRSKAALAGGVAAAADVFRALSDPHRLRIFGMIAGAQDAVCVCDLNDGLPLLQPTISHHLKVLREAGLVVGERRASWVYYRLAGGALEQLRDHLAAITKQGWSYENTPVATHREARRKRGILPKFAQRRTA